MTNDFTIVARREEAVLVRVLGLVVRRGFEPIRVAAALDAGGRLRIGLTVESERNADVLARHLAKLNEVEHVELNRGHDAGTEVPHTRVVPGTALRVLAAM